MRNKHSPEKCAHFALAFMLFCRWMDNPVPDFRPKPGVTNESGKTVQVVDAYSEVLVPGHDKGSKGKKV
jgi:hypothetical protein